MKRILAMTLAAILAASAVSCAAPTSPAASASDTAQYETYLAERGKMPDDLFIGTDSDAKQYGVDMTAFAEDGFFTRADGGNVVILAKSDEGIDRAVRDFAKYGNADDYFKTYNEGCRVKKLTVCGNDISTYCVIRPDDADECMTFAASEMVSYIEKTCGAVIPGYTQSEYAALAAKPAHKITLAVDYPALGDEAFSTTVADDGDVTILGGRYRGCMYGVYDLIEEFGWRFINDPDYRVAGPHEYLYESDHVDITPAYSHSEDSSIKNRILSDYGAFAMNTNSFGVKNKGNYTPNHVERCGYYGFIMPANHGLQISACLEYAGVYDGEAAEGHQPCFTNPDVIDAACEYAVNEVARRIEAGQKVGDEIRVVDVAQYDNMVFCNCKNCRSAVAYDGAQSGPIVTFTNAVADALAEAYGEGVSAQMFAYAGTNEPPARSVPRPNVRVSYCFYIGGEHYVCGKHSFSGTDSDGCYNAEYAGQYSKWASLVSPGNIDVWFYPFTCYNIAYHSPIYTALYDDLKYFTDVHTGGVWTCTCGIQDMLAEYLCAKMYWNPDISREEYWDLIKEWLMINYGDAGDYMYDYLRTSEMAGQRADGCWTSFADKTVNKMDEEYLASQFDRLWDMFAEAKEMADTTHQYELIEQVESGMLYGCIAATYDDWYVNGTAEQRAKIAERYTEMHRIFRKYEMPVSDDLVIKTFAPEVLNLDENPLEAWGAPGNLR